jgi:DNA mismatch repair protein MutS
MPEKNPEHQKLSAGKESALTPLMQQYHEIRARHPGMILFFRLGDFYEMFGEDAQKAARILEVVLTHRQNVPMCGVPYHAVNAYLKKLIKAGEKVAICEQLEEPGAGKGIVKRGVVRVITPGTILEDNLLEARQNNYLMALFPGDGAAEFGVACVDISTGEFTATQTTYDTLKDEISRLMPGEVIVPSTAARPEFQAAVTPAGMQLHFSLLEDWLFAVPEAARRLKEFFGLQSLKPLGLESRDLALGACGGVLAYIEKTQVGQMPPLAPVRYYSLEDYLLLDDTAVRNLEILEGLNSRSEENSLLSAVDLTLTAMGGRQIRHWLMRPLLSVAAIRERQKAVEFFVEEGGTRRSVRELLKGVADIERIVSRLTSGAAGPREIVSLKNSLLLLPRLQDEIAAAVKILALPDPVQDLQRHLAPPQDVIDTIGRAIADEPPVTLKDGGVIREGYNKDLDELRSIRRDVKNHLSLMENQERQATGIGSLKIGYTSVFGYYLEVTKSNLAAVPQHYIRKQTLTNAERFITPELKAFEEKILSAEEKLLRMEEEIFREVRTKVLAFSRQLQAIAAALAELDIYASFAETAVLYRFTRPEIDDSHVLDIKDGRHPVLETTLKSGSFVANDTFLDGNESQLILLTGPNMAGKSTYLRQVALIVVLAQAGSFVPAASARIGIIDRIFTRIGAGDNLAGGESTFMVEMHETANILRQHTARSLIILDEVGRGTSTYDGISIAQAAVEFLARSRNAAGTGPKTLFATHYFELTDLETKLPGVRNCNVAVKEWQDNVVFLHKIIPGAADRSYGIHVAKLAGLPQDVIVRANRILRELEGRARGADLPGTAGQLDFFAPAPARVDETSSNSLKIMLELDAIDPNALTPLEALQHIARWKETAQKPNAS